MLTLLEHLSLPSISSNLSFPELILPIKVILEQFKKNCGISRFQKIVNNALQIIQKQSDFIVEHRMKIKDKGLRLDNLPKLQNQLNAIISSTGERRAPIDIDIEKLMQSN